MLNPASKVGITEILSTLDDNTVLSLANTVTQGLLKSRIKNRQEAENAVLNYSSDALSFLRRKIITREILLSYLHKKNVSVRLPATKNELVETTASFWNIQYTQEAPSNAVDSNSVAQLAEQFTKWFYSMLNKNECMNPEHFYPDATLRINMSSNGQITSETVEGDPREISHKLFLTRLNFNLTFNPNVTKEGVRGQVDPHGLVMVLVCGSLHVNGTCVGVFEQVFGLVKDPQFNDNWKIKITELNLRSQSGVTALPTLQNVNLMIT